MKLSNRTEFLEQVLLLKKEQPNLGTFQALSPDEQEANMTDEELWGYAGNAVIDIHDGEGGFTGIAQKLDEMVAAEAPNFQGIDPEDCIPTGDYYQDEHDSNNPNNMDPVDIERCIIEDFDTFVLKRIATAKQFLPEDMDFWVIDTIAFWAKTEHKQYADANNIRHLIETYLEDRFNNGIDDTDED
jgi:hypothetical protein